MWLLKLKRHFVEVELRWMAECQVTMFQWIQELKNKICLAEPSFGGFCFGGSYVLIGEADIFVFTGFAENFVVAMIVSTI